MKLTRNKLIETLRQLNNGKTAYQVRKISGISVRRVNQVKKEYEATGKPPDIGKSVGRPRKPLEKWEFDTVKEAYDKYRVCADTLERLIDRDCRIRIGHNRIHRILIELGYAKLKKKFQPRKIKWIRYERRHSLTAVHIDWHYLNGTWIFGVEDDASRKMLSLVEAKHETTDESIKGMKLALKHGRIKQCISDHGTQFTSNITDGNSRFKEFLEKNGIKQILCKIKHPQSNGKIERWFDCYNRHRKAFKTLKEFGDWYNDIRPHRSLKFEILETPSQAFIRKMKK